MKKDYIPANPRAYFTMAIEVQRHAFKKEFASYKLNQSCETLVRCGFCGSNKDCSKCALQYAYEETIKALDNKEEVTRRYNLYITRMKETNQHTNFGVKSCKSKQGHITQVMFCNK